MPFVSEKQRALFYSASAKKGGAGGVSQTTAKKMIADDKPGKLPGHVAKTKKLYPTMKS